MTAPKPNALRRVLIVDDDPMQLELLARSLSYENFEVHTASSIESTARVMKETVVDFVLVDLNIPGVAWDTLIETIRSTAGPKTRVLLMSASDESKLRALVAHKNVDGYVSKSMSAASIAAKLSTINTC